MGYRSDSTEIILGRNGKIPSPELFFARLEVQKNVRYREKAKNFKFTYLRHLLFGLLKKTKKRESNRYNYSFLPSNFCWGEKVYHLLHAIFLL